MHDRASDTSSRACISGKGENKLHAGSLRSLIADSGLQNGHSISTSLRKDVQRKGKDAKSGKPFRINPLPGLLDHRDFVRVKVVSSRCDVCHVKAAVFRCAEKNVGVCENCYARMVSEWNEQSGIK